MLATFWWRRKETYSPFLVQSMVQNDHYFENWEHSFPTDTWLTRRNAVLHPHQLLVQNEKRMGNDTRRGSREGMRTSGLKINNLSSFICPSFNFTESKAMWPDSWVRYSRCHKEALSESTHLSKSVAVVLWNLCHILKI